ncbi:MAG: AI-2E family transporter, partial [Actinomycetota bacterium]
MARGIFGRRGAPPRAGAVAAPPPGAPTTAAGQHPASGVPWSLRVGAEYAWRLLVFAAALYVLLIPVRAVRLVVFAVAAA